MDCAQARSKIECHADGEFDPVASAAMDEHLAQCAACQTAFDRLGAFRSLVREGVPYHRAPERFIRDIRAQVQREARPRPVTKGRSWWPWLQPAALVAGTAVVTWMASSYLHHPSRNELLADDVIASHARATLTGRIAGVASSERHTVKPWLSSKLDYSPKVADLSGAGFPLVGGRLDYVDRRPVAVLMYGRRAHVIDLFQWPANESRATPPQMALSRQGYQVVHWKGDGMTFWAISDLNAAELQDFAQTFSRVK